MHQSPYLARTDTNVSRQATNMAQQQEAVVINMGDLNLNSPEATSPSSSKKKQDTLFGPNIGIVARGPEWTETREKAIDELTPDIVRGWIAKSKEVSLTVHVHLDHCRCLVRRTLPPCGRLQIRASTAIRWSLAAKLSSLCAADAIDYTPLHPRYSRPTVLMALRALHSAGALS